MSIRCLLRIAMLTLALVLVRPDPAAATSVTVAGITFDESAFGDRVLARSFQGVLRGGATSLGAAVLGWDTEAHADFKPNTPGQYIEIGFNNLIVNNPGDDFVVFDLRADTDEFSVSLVNLVLFPGSPSVNASIADTGFLNANGLAITIAYFDLSDLGISPGDSVTSFYVNSPRSTELALVASLNGVPEPAMSLLLLAGMLGLALMEVRRH